MTGKTYSHQIFYLNNKLYRLFSADDIPKPITVYKQKKKLNGQEMVALYISSITFASIGKHKLPSNNGKSCACFGDTNSLAHIRF